MFDATQLSTDQQTLLSQYWTYQPTLPDGTTNPQSETDFIKQQVIGLVNNVLQEQYNRNVLAGVQENQVPLITTN